MEDVCTCPPGMCACAPEISREMEAEARRWPAHRAAFYDRHPEPSLLTNCLLTTHYLLTTGIMNRLLSTD